MAIFTMFRNFALTSQVLREFYETCHAGIFRVSLTQRQRVRRLARLGVGGRREMVSIRCS